MSIIAYLDKYKELGEYFSPEYERENEILTACKLQYPSISIDDAIDLKKILDEATKWEEKFCVADLLYLYNSFDSLLLTPLVNCAIQLPDPSFNRIFLHPCIISFGLAAVCEILTEKFTEGDVVEKIKIAGLLYWVRPKGTGATDKLFNTVLQQAAATDNLVELYFYGLRFGSSIKPGVLIPANAIELTNAIKGNTSYENLLFDQLKWQRPI